MVPIGDVYERRAPESGHKPDLVFGPLDIGVVEKGSAPNASLQQVREQGSQDNRRGPVLAIAAIGVLLVVLIAAFLFSRGDELAESDAARATDLPAQETPSEALGDGAAGDGGEQPPAGAPFDPPSGSHLRADEVALLFSSEIDGDGVPYGIAYVAGGEFTVLDHRGITMPELEIAVDFATVANLSLLTSGGRTWAINADARDESFLVSNVYVVVESGRPGVIAVFDPRTQTNVGLLAAGLPVPGVDLPEGSELLWVQGRGMVVLPRTGGTFEIDGIATSLARISDARAVAVSLQATVYEDCDDQLSCTYYADTPRFGEVALPFPAGAQFSVSPDGEWVVAVVDEKTILLSIESGEQDVLTAGPKISAIAWSPDSLFVAIASGDTGDMLHVVFPGSGAQTTMRLNDAPDDGALLVFRG